MVILQVCLSAEEKHFRDVGIGAFFDVEKRLCFSSPSLFFVFQFLLLLEDFGSLVIHPLWNSWSMGQDFISKISFLVMYSFWSLKSPQSLQTSGLCPCKADPSPLPSWLVPLWDWHFPGMGRSGGNHCKQERQAEEFLGWIELVQALELLIRKRKKPGRMEGFASPSLVCGESLPGVEVNMWIKQMFLHVYLWKSERYQGTGCKPKISLPTNSNKDFSPLNFKYTTIRANISHLWTRT